MRMVCSFFSFLFHTNCLLENLLVAHNTEQIAEDDNEEDDVPVLNSANCSGFTIGQSTSYDVPNRLSCRPLYVLAKWKHPVSRDGRIALIFLLPTGILETENGVRASVVNGSSVRLTFTWPKVLLDSTKLMCGILSFCTDMTSSDGTLLSQGIMDYVESFQSKHGEDIHSNCDIPLPFEVKPDFTEDVLSFENTDVRLYQLRLSAPERKFVVQASRFKVHTIRNLEPTQPAGAQVMSTSCVNSNTQ